MNKQEFENYIIKIGPSVDLTIEDDMVMYDGECEVLIDDIDEFLETYSTQKEINEKIESLIVDYIYDYLTQRMTDLDSEGVSTLARWLQKVSGDLEILKTFAN